MGQMGQISPFLRKTERGYSHWCPACKEMHSLFDTWTFVNNDLSRPTFTPSFKHEGLKRIFTATGEWTGEWELNKFDRPIKYVCHYILTDGILNFCNDCTHDMKGKQVPLPQLPTFMQDPK